jgi:hypothetical protein
MFEAYDRGGSLPVMTDGAGNATEGSGFNVDYGGALGSAAESSATLGSAAGQLPRDP